MRWAGQRLTARACAAPWHPELAKVVRQRHPDIKLLLTSGYVGEEGVPRGLPFVPKPWRVDQVASYRYYVSSMLAPGDKPNLPSEREFRRIPSRVRRVASASLSSRARTC